MYNNISYTLKGDAVMLNRIISILSALSIFASICCVSASAAGIGACTHTSHGRDIEKTFKAAEDTSLTWMRDELLWADVEKNKGELKLPFNASWVDRANEQGIKPLVILAFGNTIYAAGKVSQEDIDQGAANTCALPVRDGNPETTDDDEYFDAFIRYVDFVSKEMKGKVGVYEIWNEPDIKFFNAKDATAEDYTELLKEAYKTIKKNDPDAQVAGGVLAYSGEFLKGMFNAGAGEYMDILSMHYYLGTDAPEDGARERLDEKREILEDFGYYDMPIWVTETGWAISNVSEETQAKFIIRNAVIYEDFLLDNGIDGQYISYELHDSNVTNEQLGGADYESSLGLIRHDYTLKKSAYAVNIYNKLTADKKLTEVKEKKFLFWTKSAYTAKFTDGDKTTLVIWSEKDKDVKINLPATETVIYDIEGNVVERITEAGTKTIHATDSPIFIEFTADEYSEAPVTFWEKVFEFFKSIFKSFYVAW